MRPHLTLVVVKVIHTVVWAFLASCIVAVPVLAIIGRLGLAAVASGIVLVEVVILAVNKMRCPLTDVAGKLTNERADNFDIYLPLWLARHNKAVFGTLFVAGLPASVSPGCGGPRAAPAAFTPRPTDRRLAVPAPEVTCAPPRTSSLP